MSNCTNCYNGCTEIISDRCIKYTGIDIPELGIQTGDTLSFVEQALSTFLLSTLNGIGIKINLDEITICNLVQQYLPTCGDLTIVDISKALIQASCNIQEQIDDIVAELTVLNANYTIGCLIGVTTSSDTHDIVQAVITKLCTLDTDLIALTLDLSTNYVSKGEDLDNYISAYLLSIGTTELISNKMVPYSILPFYGDLANFDGTGAGIGTWINIYLCNGLNSTPDLRGRVPVGITSMLGGDFPAATDPSISGNPSYGKTGSYITYGANQIILNSTQIPSHTHIATSTVSDPGHTHSYTPSARDNGDIGTYIETAASENYTAQNIGSSSTGITVSTTNTSTGGGLAHSNIQPVLSVYYIIYIPSV